MPKPVDQIDITFTGTPTKIVSVRFAGDQEDVPVEFHRTDLPPNGNMSNLQELVLPDGTRIIWRRTIDFEPQGHPPLVVTTQRPVPTSPAPTGAPVQLPPENRRHDASWHETGYQGRLRATVLLWCEPPGRVTITTTALATGARFRLEQRNSAGAVIFSARLDATLTKQ